MKQMRRLVATMAALALGTIGLGLTGSGVADAAKCPEDSAWGTGGLTPAQTYPVGVELYTPAGRTPAVVYIDDRDYIGISARGDNDGAGGLWLYLESGAKRGLQRGGNQVVLALAGLGGDAVVVNFDDPCVQAKPKNRDYIIF